MSKETLIKEIKEMLDSNKRILDLVEEEEKNTLEVENYMYEYFLFKLGEL